VARKGHDGDVAKIPIACTLSEDAAVDRLEEWRQFLRTGVVTTDSEDVTARVLLKSDNGVLLQAVDLAEREKACCSFFDFGIALDDRGRWLTIAVPPDAAPILQDLLSLAE
jgi:hypothetical protein